MEHRYALIESGQAVESDFQPLIVVLDEYRDFAGMVTDWYHHRRPAAARGPDLHR